MTAIALQHLSKHFGDTAVVHDVSLDIADRELVALLGPSGSGKTTLLRMIAGFERVGGGRILFDGTDVTAGSALSRRCGMVFQHYALFPHLDVGANVGYGLAALKLDRSEARARVAEVLALVDLSGFERRPVTALSGGQQQRVAVARALAPRPKVLLLDEPLSNLDPSLRERTRRELGDLVREIGITTILVTHEQEEAFDLADRVAVLHRGRLDQVGAPAALYETPETAFVAGFVGRASRITGTAVGRDGHRVVVDAVGTRWHAIGDAELHGPVELQVRPEALRLALGGPVRGTVLRHRFAGAVTYLTVGLEAGVEVEVSVHSGDSTPGATVALEPTGVGVHAYPLR